jgi:glyoxylase-like metal-dependent hydrolase (beta-lactamase superfamily II)
MHIQHFFDKNTATFSYVVQDEATKQCAIIDSVMDYTPESGRIAYDSANALIAYIKKEGLEVQWILETHLHADHLTAAHYLQSQVGGKIGIGSLVTKALNYWTEIFNTQEDTPVDGSQFDHLFQDNETFYLGNIPIKVIHTPGHTPMCVSYLIEDAIFVGDALFMPYVGTARTDFPGGSAKTLYHSIQKILALPGNTKIFTGHDYPLEGKEPAYLSTIQEQKASNILINDAITEEQYIVKRNQRDEGKAVPKLLLPAIQVNLRAGTLGKPESNGKQYIKIPIGRETTVFTLSHTFNLKLSAPATAFT